MKPIILIGVAIAVSIAIVVTVNVFILTPEQTPPAAEPVASESESFKGLPPECDALQAKVDDAGRPGWDRLEPSLQAEIEAAPGCYILGDEERF